VKRVITKRKIVQVARQMTRTTVTRVRRSVIRHLGAEKVEQLGEKKVKKLVKKAIERKAVRVLKDAGYSSACRGLCGRRMRKVARKVRTQRKKFEKQVRGLKKFKTTIVKKQIKKLGLPKHKISKKEYKSKVTVLNAKFAEGLITRTEWL